MQLSELQNELRIERMQRDTQAVSLHDTQGRLHAADAAELASLRQQRDETGRARAEAAVRPERGAQPLHLHLV